LFADAVTGGARSLGVDDTNVGLVAGAPADVVSLDTKNPSLASRRGDALIEGWLFAARHSAIDCVWRHGRKVVSQGTHVRRDQIGTRYRAALGKLMA
jgi:cytosine/adenosine deaminase-related metal-dependent hydrolase